MNPEKKTLGKNKRHRHLQGLHLVFGFGGDEQAQTQQREDINQALITINAMMLPAIGTLKTKRMMA